MPTDTVPKPVKTKGVRMIRQRREHSEESVAMNRYDFDTDIMPAAFRARLYNLFSQIEKEFEGLYAENLTLHDRIDVLNERLGASSDKATTESHDQHDGSVKPKRSASQISQKIKTTYKVSTSKIVSSFRAPSGAYSLVREYRGHRDGVWEVSLSRPGQQVIGTASADHTARIWGIESGLCLLQYVGHSGSVNAIRFHPSQDLVLTASGDQTAHIWQANVTVPATVEAVKSHSSGEDEIDGSEKEDGEDPLDQSQELTVVRNAVQELSGHHGVVVSADWMSGGSQVITASWDRTAILHDSETGEHLSTLTGHDQELTEVRAHPTQRLVVTASKDTTFRLWDFRDHAMKVNVFQGHTQQITSAIFAGNDRVISGSDDRTVKVWDLKNMRSPIATIRTDSAINRLAASERHNMIAIPHDNRHVRLFEFSGARIGRLPRNNRQGHSRMVCSVAWADDNPVCNLFSCGFDRQVIGWQVAIQSKE